MKVNDDPAADSRWISDIVLIFQSLQLCSFASTLTEEESWVFPRSWKKQTPLNQQRIETLPEARRHLLKTKIFAVVRAISARSIPAISTGRTLLSIIPFIPAEPRGGAAWITSENNYACCGRTVAQKVIAVHLRYLQLCDSYRLPIKLTSRRSRKSVGVDELFLANGISAMDISSALTIECLIRALLYAM